MSRKESILLDPQVIVQPATYHSHSQLTAGCARCRAAVIITLGNYWRRRQLGDWVCTDCRRRELAATAAQNPLYRDPEYRARFARLHQDPEYRARVHNQVVYAKVAESARAAWHDEHKRARHLAHRAGPAFRERTAAVLGQHATKHNLDQRSREFARKAAARHGEYSGVEYQHSRVPVTIGCERCGYQFTQQPLTHPRGSTCPRCNVSDGQHQLHAALAGLLGGHGGVLVNDRSAIAPYELDLYVPDKRLAVEYHGVFWHSYDRPEAAEERLRHQRKALLARTAGISLLQVYDHEWARRRPIILSMLAHRLGITGKILDARRLEVVRPSERECAAFLEANHLAGYRSARLAFGLAGDTGLVCLITLSRSGAGYELIRAATATGHLVRGGLSRLLGHARREVNASISTFADLRYSNGAGYVAAGFTLQGITRPGYFYWRNGEVLSRQRCQKHKLAGLLGNRFDPGKSEAANLFAAGYRRCWNAGHLRFG